MKIYVDINAPINGDGSQERPFKAIQSAANIAMPGDEVLVAPGTYRENVDPKHAGTADQRIIYRSTEPLGAVITGAERVATWEALAGDVWQVRIPNSIFGNYNPYTTRVLGDWFDARIVAHTGEVYLNDKALYEVNSLDEVKSPVKNMKSWYPEDTLLTWFTEQDVEQNETVIYANFQGGGPKRRERRNQCS